VKRSTSVLIIGYNRPELVLASIKRLERVENVKKIVSIDGQKFPDARISSQWTAMSEEFPNFTWIIREENLGLAKHVFTAISEAMKESQNCIVLEDDVVARADNIIKMNCFLEKRLPNSVLTIGLFGGIPAFPFIRSIYRNRWRYTKYFSAWGWGIQREDWHDFSLDIARRERENLDNIIKDKLGKNRLSIWKRRFEAVADSPAFTWDYQLFLYSLILGKRHILPTYRTCENIGFEDVRASNTRDARPSWYRGRAAVKVDVQKLRRHNSIGSLILQWVDSLTWAGDQPLMQKFREFKRKFLG
jgi:hypothetical protein